MNRLSMGSQNELALQKSDQIAVECLARSEFLSYMALEEPNELLVLLRQQNRDQYNSELQHGARKKIFHENVKTLDDAQLMAIARLLTRQTKNGLQNEKCQKHGYSSEPGQRKKNKNYVKRNKKVINNNHLSESCSDDVSESSNNINEYVSSLTTEIPDSQYDGGHVAFRTADGGIAMRRTYKKETIITEQQFSTLSINDENLINNNENKMEPKTLLNEIKNKQKTLIDKFEQYEEDVKKQVMVGQENLENMVQEKTNEAKIYTDNELAAMREKMYLEVMAKVQANSTSDGKLEQLIEAMKHQKDSGNYTERKTEKTQLEDCTAPIIMTEQDKDELVFATLNQKNEFADPIFRQNIFVHQEIFETFQPRGTLRYLFLMNPKDIEYYLTTGDRTGYEHEYPAKIWNSIDALSQEAKHYLFDTIKGHIERNQTI